jgi:hypothetical protein
MPRMTMGNTYSRLEFLRGHLTNDLVYSRLAPGVLDELRRITPKNEKGRRKGTFSQRLTPDIGVPRLREHVKAVTVLMKASDDWETSCQCWTGLCRGKSSCRFLMAKRKSHRANWRLIILQLP